MDSLEKGDTAQGLEMLNKDLDEAVKKKKKGKKKKGKKVVTLMCFIYGVLIQRNRVRLRPQTM